MYQYSGYYRAIFFPLVFFAMIMILVRSSPRHLLADQITLLIIISLGSALYVKTAWLTRVIICYSILILIANTRVLNYGFSSQFLQYIAEFKYPIDAELSNRDFVDRLHIQAITKRQQEEVIFLDFLISNAIVFFACLACDLTLRSKSLELCMHKHADCNCLEVAMEEK